MTDIFNTTKYTTWYNSIIENARLENRQKLSRTEINFIYYENHHIIPKSLDGLDIIENLVLLTAKEHFMCHLLLMKMCVNVGHMHKMVYAFNLLTNARGATQDRVTGKNIAWAKEKFIEARKKVVPWNKGLTGVYSKETRKKMGEDKIGKVYSEEYKKNMSETLKKIQPSKKTWLVTTPNGEELIIEDRRKFCLEHGLSWGNVTAAALNNRKYQGYFFKDVLKPKIFL